MCGGLGDMVIIDLARCENLRLLQVAFWEKLTDDGVATMATMPKLETVGVACCIEVTAWSILHLSKSTSITNLSLTGEPDVNIGVVVKNMKQLTALDLTCSGVTDDDLALLCEGDFTGRHLRLTTLKLNMCSLLTNAGLQCILNMPSLEHLEISEFNEVADDALLNLAEHLHQLQTLVLTECSGINDSTLVKLRKLGLAVEY